MFPIPSPPEPISLASIFGSSNYYNWDAQESLINAKQAADFDRNSASYLTSVDTDFDLGAESATMGGWFYSDTSSSNDGLMGKYRNGEESYMLWKQGGVPSWRFNMATPSGNKNVVSSETITTGWHFIVGVYDIVSEEVKISVDGGAFDVNTGAIGGFAASNEKFGIGGYSGFGSFLGNNYYADEVFFYKGRALSLAEISALYNSGNGTAYGDLSEAQKVDLLSWWEFDSLPNLLIDTHGGKTLTNSNSVGVIDGKVQATIDNNDPVSKWSDSGVNAKHHEQATLVNRPVYKSSGLNSKPAIDFDEASGEYMEAGSIGDFNFIHDGTISWTAFGVFELDASTGSNQVISGTTFSSTGEGIIINVLDSTNQVKITIGNGTSVIMAVETTNTFVYGTPFFLIIGYNKTNDEFEAYLGDTTTLDTDARVGSFSASDHSQLLMTGGRPGAGTLNIDGKQGQLVIGKEKIPSEVADQVRTYINNKWEI